MMLICSIKCTLPEDVEVDFPEEVEYLDVAVSVFPEWVEDSWTVKRMEDYKHATNAEDQTISHGTAMQKASNVTPVESLKDTSYDPAISI
jgi:hypothetical protein